MADDRIAELIEQLKSMDEMTRINATQELRKIGKPAVLALTEALNEGNIDAIRALRDIGDASSLSALIEALKDEDSEVRWRAALALGKIGDKSAVPVLIKSLKDERFVVRYSAAEALGRIGDASAVPALIKALMDEDDFVRLRTAKVLGKIIGKCEKIEDVETVEKDIIEGSKAFRKGPHTGVLETQAQVTVVDWLKQIAERKNKLAPKRDLLLPDTVKPPKKGIYSSMRKMQAF